MYEMLDNEESMALQADIKYESTRENLPNQIIFIDSNLNPCDELMYRSSSGCELMEAVIESSIDDNLLDVNFMKSDSSLDQMSYFHTDSLPKLTESKSKLFEKHKQPLCALKNEIEDSVIVEDMAEEVISELKDQSQTSAEDLLFDVQSKTLNVFDGFKKIRSLKSNCLVREFECYKCEKKFRQKKNLEHHIRSHLTVEKRHNASSESISLETKKIINRLRTKKKKLSNEEPLSLSQTCELCGHHSDDADSMREHVRNHKKYQCLYCDQMFMSHQSVTEHSRAEHGTHCDRFMCFYCGKRCKDFRGLQKHSRVHMGGELLICNVCGKQFYARNRLKRHMLSHRDKAVFCEECGEKTSDHRALANHRSSHHVIISRSGTLTTRTFPCYACNKVFGSRSSQQIHMRIHTGERPYSCKYCVKAFADGGTLRKHERIHTGEKPYVCLICQKAFNQRVVLREHIRAHHAGQNMTSNKLYRCEVCSTICSSSQDLCSHLVKHSDDNTAKQRTGSNRPRKYKKWKPGKVVISNDECSMTNDHSPSVVSTASVDLSESLCNLANESFCILTDEKSFDDVRCSENDFISPPPVSGDEEEDVNKVVEFEETNRKYSGSSGSSDHCSLFNDQTEFQKWKMIRGDESINEVKSYGDSPFSYQLLIPFDDKLPDESISIHDSCENGNSSYSDTCLNLTEIADQRQDTYFEASHYIGYTSTKSRLRFTLEEKSDYEFDSDLCMHSGLGLGAIVELT